MSQKNYDLMGDLLEEDVLILFRQVLREEESLLKVWSSDTIWILTYDGLVKY